MMLGGLLRQMKKGSVDDEKQSHRHISRFIAIPDHYSDIHLYSHDYTVENHPSPTSLLMGSTVITALSPAAPTLMASGGPSYSPSLKATNKLPSGRSTPPPRSDGGIPLYPSSRIEHKPDRHEGAPDLTGQVTSLSTKYTFEGTYSNIYKGIYNGHEVAVKAIRGVKYGKAFRRKFRREIETWWRLQHPNILPCLGYVENDGLGEYGAMVSPWCKNGTAADHLARNPPSFQRVEMLLDVARGLRYLHQFSPAVVHGDLKPSNVLIDELYNAKLCDFGLVRLIQEQETTTGMTTTTAHTGTARYLAYELVDDEQVPTAASDIYALGCIGLEFIFSLVPHAQVGNGQQNAHYKICREIARHTPPAVRPNGLDATLGELWSLLEACWHSQADKRPTANHIVEYLEKHSQEIVDSRQRMLVHS